MKVFNKRTVTWLCTFFLFLIILGCENKEQRAFEIAKESNSLTELDQYLATYKEDASAYHVNTIRERIERLRNEKAAYDNIQMETDMSLQYTKAVDFLNKYKNSQYSDAINEIRRKDELSLNRTVLKSNAENGKGNYENDNANNASENQNVTSSLINNYSKFFYGSSLSYINNGNEIYMFFHVPNPQGYGEGAYGSYYNGEMNSINVFNYNIINANTVYVYMNNIRYILKINSNGIRFNNIPMVRQYIPEAYEQAMSGF